LREYDDSAENQDRGLATVGNRVMSVPISAMSTRAVVSLRLGMVVNKADGGVKGTERISDARFDRRDGRVQGIDLRKLQLVKKPMVRRHAPMNASTEVDALRFETALRQLVVAQTVAPVVDHCSEDLL
jgi:hypothetical protein